MSESTPAARPTVAVLGTGIMGSGMARSAAAAGLDVRVWNRSAGRAEALGDVATVAASAAEAVQGADVVVTMLLDAGAVAEVIGSAAASFAPGAVWLQMSTVGVDGERRLADLAGEHGVTYVDAPVLGTKEPAAKGSLVVLASGPEQARAAVTPVCEAMGSRTLWVGAAGAGSRLKLACNAWVLTVVEGVAESLALARGLGLDPALVLEAVSGQATDAPYVQAKGRAMLEDTVDDQVSFPLSGAAKDAGLIVAAARGAGLDLEVLEAVRRRMDAARGAGHGGADMAATYRALQPAAGAA